MHNQDEIVHWDCIEQIVSKNRLVHYGQWFCKTMLIVFQKMFSTQFIKCPICMDIPITPKMTRCGHIYCWPCILRYLDINDELNVAGCPICHASILKKELHR